jgi:hypothetical protein
VTPKAKIPLTPTKPMVPMQMEERIQNGSLFLSIAPDITAATARTCIEPIGCQPN